jgi:hypothetical protein
VPAVAGLGPKGSIALLDRAAEVGLLAAVAPGRYGVHPAVPWYLHGLFEQHYGPPGSATARVAVRAWTRAISEHGNLYAYRYEHGDAAVIGALAAPAGHGAPLAPYDLPEHAGPERAV